MNKYLQITFTYYVIYNIFFMYYIHFKGCFSELERNSGHYLKCRVNKHVLFLGSFKSAVLYTFLSLILYTFSSCSCNCMTSGLYMSAVSLFS